MTMTTTQTTLATAARSEQLLTFIVDGREYGVDILRVQEIRGWSPAMPIPNAPPFIRGVINIRGDIVPIADLRRAGFTARATRTLGAHRLLPRRVAFVARRP